MMPQRPPMSGPPMPPSRPPVSPVASGAVALALAIAVVLGVPIAVVLVVTLWTPAWAFSAVLTSAIERGGALIGYVFLLAIAGGAFVLLSRGWAGALRMFAQAHKERIIKMQTGQPIDVRDVTPIANRTVTPSLQAHYSVAMQEARREHPELRTYHHVNQVRNEPPALPEPQSPAPAGNVPTFAQLLDEGKIGGGRPFLLGFDAAGGPALTSNGFESLYSCGIGALQGAGKSWLAAFILAQSAAQGGRLIICDLHYGNSESLGSRVEALAPAFMCDIASTPDAIVSALKLASDKLQQRKAGRGGNWPIVIAVDEWTSLLRTKVGDVLPGYLEDFAEQGRKFNVNALLAAQGWTKDTAGVVRNRLTSHYVLRQRPDEARYQLGLGAGQLPLDIRLLPDAMGYLLDVRGNLTKIVVPQMTSADLARVGQMIAAPANTNGAAFGFIPATRAATFAQPAATPIAAKVAENRPESSQKVAGSGAATTASGTATARSPEAVRAAALFFGGSSPADIVKELRGVDSKQGARYQSALNDILQLIREGA